MGTAVSDMGKNEDSRQGAIIPLRNEAEREVIEGLQPSLSTGSRLADESDQGSLVSHEVSLQDGHVASILPVHGHALESQMFQ
jgi:hypothetical protein